MSYLEVFSYEVRNTGKVIKYADGWYIRHQVITPCQPTTYPMSQLRDDYNRELSSQQIDAVVPEVRQFTIGGQTNIVTDVDISTAYTEGKGFIIPAAIVATILLLIKLVAITAAIIVIASVISGLVRTLVGAQDFYAEDGTRLGSMATLVTYTQSLHPDKYVCHYCAAVFDTAAERDAHEAQCPYKNGIPGYSPSNIQDLINAATIGLVVILAIVTVPKVIDIVGRRS